MTFRIDLHAATESLMQAALVAIFSGTTATKPNLNSFILSTHLVDPAAAQPNPKAASSSFVESQQRISELQELRKDWNTYGADPPNQRAILNAKRFLTALVEANLLPSRVNPSADGGVAMTFSARRGKRYAWVEFCNDGEVVATTSNGGGQVDAWNVCQEDGAEADTIGNSIERIATFLSNE